MNLLNTNVSVFEPNETRADLYAMWLGELNVRVALTRQEADDVLDGSAGVIVVSRTFADGEAPKLVEIARARNPVCATVGIRSRSDGFAEIDPENHLVKPVFEEDLKAVVSRLLRRVNYRIALEEFYRASTALASMEYSDSGPSGEKRERRDELSARVDRLERTLAEYRQGMDREDVAAVIQSITSGNDIEHTSGESTTTSKYHPDKCTNCDREWKIGPKDDRARGFKQLGAFVWRCVECGHIQMQADPSHQHVGSYRI